MTDNKTGERWKFLFYAVLLHGTERITNSSPVKTSEALDNRIRKGLPIRGGECKNAPKLLRPLFACHVVGFMW